MTTTLKRVAVLGLGKVGSLVGTLLARSGFTVTGIDANPPASLSFDVRKQDAHVLVPVDVDLMELTRRETSFVVLLARDVADHLPRDKIWQHCGSNMLKIWQHCGSYVKILVTLWLM